MLYNLPISKPVNQYRRFLATTVMMKTILMTKVSDDQVPDDQVPDDQVPDDQESDDQSNRRGRMSCREPIGQFTVKNIAMRVRNLMFCVALG
ncbi:hypothetical protein B7R70_08745 [Yersinia pseudotuberculosis]|nr:hypothetical protein [Yersinia pseudotuberculosis]PSH34485.1 hypothetical protein BA192_03485 [Yersinia pseudotuberculosis]PSH44951.1 hypothetical protein BA194_04900 [Yersinia pseudotuberculosis]PSH48594.1 hypothetical protein BA193_06555 [Yersinia pseudotuberculosis]PST79895.1 hypothetical protein B7R70_08745 [Yersinia pseudotuberculosis]